MCEMPNPAAAHMMQERPPSGAIAKVGRLSICRRCICTNRRSLRTSRSALSTAQGGHPKFDCLQPWGADFSAYRCEAATPAGHVRWPAFCAERLQLANALQPRPAPGAPGARIKADLREARAACQPCSTSKPRLACTFQGRASACSSGVHKTRTCTHQHVDTTAGCGSRPHCSIESILHYKAAAPVYLEGWTLKLGCRCGHSFWL